MPPTQPINPEEEERKTEETNFGIFREVLGSVVIERSRGGGEKEKKRKGRKVGKGKKGGEGVKKDGGDKVEKDGDVGGSGVEEGGKGDGDGGGDDREELGEFIDVSFVFFVDIIKPTNKTPVSSNRNLHLPPPPPARPNLHNSSNHPLPIHLQPSSTPINPHTTSQHHLTLHNRDSKHLPLPYQLERQSSQKCVRGISRGGVEKAYPTQEYEGAGRGL